MGEIITMGSESTLNEKKFKNVTPENVQLIIDRYPFIPGYGRLVISLNRKENKAGIILPGNQLEDVQYVIAASENSAYNAGDKVLIDFTKMTVRQPMKHDVTRMEEKIKVDPIEIEGFEVYAVLDDRSIKGKFK